jgi:hypothetical protein
MATAAVGVIARNACPKNTSNSSRSLALRFSRPFSRSVSSCDVPAGILKWSREIECNFAISKEICANTLESL